VKAVMNHIGQMKTVEYSEMLKEPSLRSTRQILKVLKERE